MRSNADQQLRATRCVPGLVYYHRDLDGLVAGWAVWSAYTRGAREAVGMRTIDVQYGEPPPTPADVCGKSVAVVDFAWPEHVLTGLRATASELVVIDHHKTAEWLTDFPGAIWDVSKSGCRLAWEAFHPDEPPPPIVLFTEDRDLWRWSLPGTREYCAALENLDWSMQAMDEAADFPFERLIETGRVLVSYQDRFAERVARKAVPGTLRGGHAARFVDTGSSSGLVSEIGDAMGRVWPDATVFVMLRWQGGDKWIVSLRSRSCGEGGPDVGAIARSLGGGGHKHAAGFVCDWSQLQALLPGEGKTCA